MTYTPPHIWLLISSGQGPDECELAVHYVFEHLTIEAKLFELCINVLERVPGNQRDTYQSILLSVTGHKLSQFVKIWEGSIQWICCSPYRPTHKRKNWFVGVSMISPLDTYKELDDNSVRFETMRASGAGGQHVNTTEGAVRAVHVPTGLITYAQQERSQHLNKKLALRRLAELIQRDNKHKQLNKGAEKRNKHYDLERGNPVRVFIGTQFKEQH